MWKQLETQGLPRPFYIVADAAYTGFTGIVCPYSGNNLTVYEDSLNFHVSQVHIEIECAFWMLRVPRERVGNVAVEADDEEEDRGPVFNEFGCPADGL
eukprot:2342657-Rhodomonas_salina.2